MPPQDSMQQPYQLNRVLYYYTLLPWSTTQAFAPDQRKLLGACTVPSDSENQQTSRDRTVENTVAPLFEFAFFFFFQFSSTTRTN
jgi:hypothetical protein